MQKLTQNESKTIKFLEENTGVSHFDLGLSNSFLDMIPKAQVKNNKNK